MKTITICRSDLMWWIFSFLTIFMVTSTASKQYRKDYEYNKETDAFYKFHMEPVQYRRTNVICNYEGASLMVPKSEEDILQAHGMFKQYPDISNLAWVGNDGIQHFTPEINSEIPLIVLDDYRLVNRPIGRPYSSSECDVIERNGEIYRDNCYQSLPFICKVDAKDAFVDNECKVFGRGYKYFESVGSCYKIPPMAYSWDGAYSECRAEDAHLIILNSELEHQIIYNLTNEARRSIDNAQAFFFFLAGIRAEKEKKGSPIVFKTIFNQTLEEAGYSEWSENEPNNALGNEYCGTIFMNDGKYNDIACSDPFGFICEKEVKTSQ